MLSSHPGGPSLLVVETGASLIAAALAFCCPRVAGSVFSRTENIFGKLAHRRRLAVAVVGLAQLAIRLSLLPLIPEPKPFIHDEFSFLLASDTFASGRLTNATHPMWQHFESFHITQKPTYMSMYFPGQGLIMAAGKRVAGDPWYGVCAGAAIMCCAICWMLQGWFTPGWAFFGGMLAVVRLGLFTYWVNSYYGGAVAAIGGCLVLGALARMRRTARVRDGLLMSAGFMILANTRPWEGVLVALPVGIILLRWLFTRTHPPASTLLRRAVPSIALILVTATLMGYYNYRVFGSPWTLPYQVNRATYASAPVFLWQQPRPAPRYRYAVMRDFYLKWEIGDFLYAKTPTGFLSRTLQKAAIALFFIAGPALFAPLFALPWIWRDHRIRPLVFTAAFFAFGACLNAWLFPHYLAPVTGALYAILLLGMRHLRVWRPAGKPYGLALVRWAAVVCLMLAVVRPFASPLHIDVPRWPSMWYGTQPLGLPHAQIAAQLEKRTRPQLAIVRYSAAHSVFDDWVYNQADLDHAHVVWAREMNTDQDLELLRYFSDREVSLVQPDAAPATISPYEPNLTLRAGK